MTSHAYENQSSTKLEDHYTFHMDKMFKEFANVDMKIINESSNSNKSSSSNSSTSASSPFSLSNEQLKEYLMLLSNRYIKWTSNDQEVIAFLENSEKNAGGFKDAMATLLKSVTGMSQTDVNALCGRGKMFVFSRSQFLSLLPQHFHSLSSDASSGNGMLLLDIGAGDGSITEIMQSVLPVQKVFATEVSSPMIRVLKSKGFVAYGPDMEALDLSNVTTYGKHCFDVISCLNVIDRADFPKTLLKNMRNLLKPNVGRLVLAVVLPWCPFVESGSKQLPPTENFNEDFVPLRGRCRDKASFERSFVCIALTLRRLGYEVEKWTKSGYLCEGDSVHPYYSLSDAVLCLKSVPIDGDNGDNEIILPGELNQ